MFRDLMRVWAEHTFSQRVVDDFLSMLEDSEEMLEYVFRVLTDEGKGKKSDKKVYKKDQRINLTEREIRRQVLIHLSTNPAPNLPACLGLISIVKDAERLGDYVKNLFELKELSKDSKEAPDIFRSIYDEVGSSLMQLFKDVASAFENSDRILARNAIESGVRISRRCEEIINEVADSDYKVRDAVVSALGVRYIKRIALHLTNIVSSVNNPLPELDFKSIDEGTES
jgi:phosphate uptake regulator